jgi:hypothetical protein
MADLSAKNFGIAGIFVILFLLAGLMLFGFMTYLAWNTENPWPASTYQHSGQVITPPPLHRPHYAPAILYGVPPIPAANRQTVKL